MVCADAQLETREEVRRQSQNADPLVRACSPNAAEQGVPKDLSAAVDDTNGAPTKTWDVASDGASESNALVEHPVQTARPKLTFGQKVLRGVFFGENPFSSRFPPPWLERERRRRR
jgi:hypothetical protein